MTLLNMKSLDGINDETLEEAMLDRPIASIRDLQYTYGKLFQFAAKGTGKYAPYRTPDAEAHLVGEENRLLILRFDVGNDVVEFDGAELTDYKNEYTEHINFSANKAPRGCDNSISQKTSVSGYEPEKLGEWATKKILDQWPKQNSVTTLINNERSDDALLRLLQSTDYEEFVQPISEAVREIVAEQVELVVAPKFKLEPGDDYAWAGDIEILNEGMAGQFREDLTTRNLKGAGDAPSEGTGVCMVTGKTGRLVGTPDDPLGYYLTKQQGTFQRLNRENSWRSHPVSEDVALTMRDASSFVDVCTTYLYGMDVSFLPYPQTTIDASTARNLYKLLCEIYLTDRPSATLDVEYGYNRDWAGEIAFMKGLDRYKDGDTSQYSVFLVGRQQLQANRYNVLIEEPSGSVYHPVTLAETHSNIIKKWAENDTLITNIDGGQTVLKSDEESLLQQFLSGWYFSQTLPHQQLPPNSDPSIDDARSRFQIQIIGYDRINVEELVSEYAAGLADEWGGDDDGESSRVPEYLIASQTAQLEALATAGFLKSPNGSQMESLTQPPEYMTDDSSAQTQQTNENTEEQSEQQSRAAKRKQELKSYIDSRPALDDRERRGSFLIGVLVGYISRYQNATGKGRTLAESTPISTLSKRRLGNVLNTAQEKNIAYSAQSQQVKTIMYRDVIEELLETMLYEPITEWSIAPDDMRLAYAQGVLYGQTYYGSKNEENVESDELTASE